MTDASKSSNPRAGPLGAVTGHLVDSVRVSERRRVALVVVVPLLFWLVVELAANLGYLPLVAAVGLGAFLYTRATAGRTVAASAYATGVLAATVAVFRVYRAVAGGSTASLVDTVVTHSPWAVAGIALLAFGVWLHRADL